MIMSMSEHRVVVPEDDQAERLRAWLRSEWRPLDGDEHEGVVGAEPFQDADVVRLAVRLRTCVSRGCLEPESVRGVPDLIAHAARHVERLTESSLRAFRVLSSLEFGAHLLSPRGSGRPVYTYDAPKPEPPPPCPCFDCQSRRAKAEARKHNHDHTDGLGGSAYYCSYCYLVITEFPDGCRDPEGTECTCRDCPTCGHTCNG
jgi:hypothetical protein